MFDLKKKYIILIISAITLIDQLIKYIVTSTIKIGESKSFFGQVVVLHYVQNTGSAFSIGNNKLFIIILLNIILIGALLYGLLKNFNKLNESSIISTSMILGGGISNLLDRLFRGFVVDYIDINYLFQYPVFNLADIFIVIGVLFLIIILLFRTPLK